MQHEAKHERHSLERQTFRPAGVNCPTCAASNTTGSKNCASRKRKEHWRTPSGQVLTLGLAATLFVLGLVFRSNLQLTPLGLGEYAVFLSAYFLVGRKVILTAGRNLVKGKLFDENFLMTIASMGALAIGEIPEAAGVMLFYYIGELFQETAVAKSRRSIQALLDIRPEYANLKVGSDLKRVDPRAVETGDTIVVRPGERIPLDGAIIEGESFVDMSALTGESVPVRVSPGETVLAGTVNGSGLLTVKVTRRFSDSSLARILDLVENAADRKAPTEKFITRFARYYTPAVVFTAAALAALPPLVISGAGFSEWLHRALILLVISCPCALVISTPLGYFAGIGAASRQGILVKGANYLEALSDVDTVIFDKTGTLTEGVFQVSRVVPTDGKSKEELLSLAALAEMHSQHPIAASIREAHRASKREAYQAKPFSFTASHGPGDAQPADTSGPVHVDEPAGVDRYEEIAGHGVKATVDGRQILVGNERLLQSHNIAWSPLDVPGTVVYVAVDGSFVGSIVISDHSKPDAAAAVRRLRELGVRKTAMLTGDRESVAHQVAKQLRIDEVQANLLPEDKVIWLEKFLANKKRRNDRKVAFVGDGINDAPVITRADIGIAMGGLGSDAAIEAADVVIMEDRPGKVAEAISIARRTRRIIRQNIIFALAIKTLFIFLGAAGLTSMWAAVFADVGVALLAVCNATRALRLKPYKEAKYPAQSPVHTTSHLHSQSPAG